MVGAAGADGEDIEVGRHRAGPSVFYGQLGRHRLVEGSRWRREHDGEVMVVTHARWADVLYAHVGHGTAPDGSEIPRHRARAATNRAAGGRSGLSGDCRRVMKQHRYGKDRKQTDRDNPYSRSNESH